MATESGRKPSVAAQVDYDKLRHPPGKDDLELSAEGRAWLASNDESVRPKELSTAFPRIVNHMARLWRTPRQMDRYFEDLLTDNRGGTRKGFPFGVLMELSALKQHYQTKVYAIRRDVWE
jgi:hypothetical protein